MVTISIKKVVQVLALVILCLTLANAFAQLYKLGFLAGLGSAFDINEDRGLGMFDFGEEKNIPTWYSSATLLLCSILLATITTVKKQVGDRYTLHWGALSVIFLFLSADEAAGLHEKAADIMELSLHITPGGFIRYTWVILYGALLLVFVLATWKFLLHLPPKTRGLFVIAGFIFVGGALGMEMITAYRVDLYGVDEATLQATDLVQAVLVSVEELLEMLGVLVFLYALLSYISTHLKDIRARVNDK